MSRLTELIEYYDWKINRLAEGYEVATKYMETGEIKEYNEGCQRTDDTLGALKELQHYKDLEEQGRLIELPCLPDEFVYATHEDCRTVRASYESIEHILYALEAGWCIGYTEAEAEAKLAEMKEGGTDD